MQQVTALPQSRHMLSPPQGPGVSLALPTCHAPGYSPIPIAWLRTLCPCGSRPQQWAQGGWPGVSGQQDWAW